MQHDDRSIAANSVYSLRKRPRQARAIATVDAILDAAARILTEDGYAAASTNRIAERAGVSIGSLYEYFPGKEAIFAELRRREGHKFYRELIAQPRPQQPRAAICHIVRGRLNWMRRDPVLYAALETEVPRAAIAEVEAEVFDDFLGISVAFLEAHREMLRPEADLRFLAEFLMHTVSATANTYGLRAPDQLDDPRLEQAMIEMVERYLLKDDC
ncbi:MAG: TetR/AcrR family transcriptional regulator [Gammaproteobacteria bacterium]|nr:TetR/AcrR family transcriptional regulator [Gammaproteobacteria bacterium]